MIYLAIVSLIWAFSFGLIGSMPCPGWIPFSSPPYDLGVPPYSSCPFYGPRKLCGATACGWSSSGRSSSGSCTPAICELFTTSPPTWWRSSLSSPPSMWLSFMHDLRQRTFSSRYLVAALVSVVGAGAIKAKTIPTGDFWIGFGLMQAAGIAFAYGQVAYRDWKRNNPQTNDRSVYSPSSPWGERHVRECPVSSFPT